MNRGKSCADMCTCPQTLKVTEEYIVLIFPYVTTKWAPVSPLEKLKNKPSLWEHMNSYN